MDCLVDEVPRKSHHSAIPVFQIGFAFFLFTRFHLISQILTLPHLQFEEQCERGTGNGERGTGSAGNGVSARTGSGCKN